MGALKVNLVSLGCARTLVDSEVALGGLKKEGYQIVGDVGQADIAVVNTCGFIEEAKLESIETILKLCEMKKKGRLSAVVVLGCLAQRHGEELRKELGSQLDGIIGTDDYGSLAQVLKPLKEKNQKVYQVKAKPRYLLNEDTPRFYLTPPHFAYVKISEGCINACSYCVIPKMKGPHRSRTIESVVSEVKKIAGERKLSEIDLIGQDTAAFGWDLDRSFQLPRLLRELAKLDAAPWLRLLYAHPGHVSDELIDAIAEHRTICRYIDFPIEHSHDAVLKRMNRGVDRAKMEWGIRTLRKKMPGVTIRTTVIVGFPGETDEEFEDLMDFLRQTRFERLGAFQFSREEGATLFTDLDVKTAADALSELEPQRQVELITGLDAEKAADILEEMPPDEASDVLADLPTEKAREILERVEEDEAKEIQELLAYDEDTAGGLMTTALIAYTPETSVREAIERFRTDASAVESVYHVYVVEAADKLVGTISLRALLLAGPSATLASIADLKPRTVPPETDRRAIAALMAKYDLIALPVVDGKGHLLGVVTIDDIISQLSPARGRRKRKGA